MSADNKAVKLCNVDGCESETKLNESVSYYPLPLNRNPRLDWCKALGLDINTPQFIVCSAHFTDDDFSSVSRAGVITFRHLKTGAVPNLNLPSHSKLEYKLDKQDEEITIKQDESMEYNVTLSNSTAKRLFKMEQSLNSASDSADEKDQIILESVNSEENENNQNEENQIEYEQVEHNDTKYAIVQQDEDGNMTYQLLTDDNQLEMFEDGQYVVQYDNVSQEGNSVLEQGVDVQVSEGEGKKVRKRGRGRKRDKEVLEHFEVTVLTLDEQIAEIQSRASSSNYINAAYKCDLCYKGYMTENTYNSHMAKHGEQSGPFQCVVCQRCCKTQLALRGHMLNHVYKYKCKKCDFCARNKAGAELHISWHNGTVYQCDMCEQSFERVSTLMTHVRIKHPSDFVCGLCGYSFIGQKGLNYHRKLKHRLDERPIPEDGPTCDTCLVQFVSDEALFRHIKVSPRHIDVAFKERNEPPQPRGLRRIRNRSPRKRVERRPQDITPHTHEDTGDGADGDDDVAYRTSKFTAPVKCELCTTSVTSPREYHLHYRRDHPNHTRAHYPQLRRPQLCHYCGRVFTCQATLKDHLLKHTGEATLTCSECGNRYHTMSSLQNHQRIHLGPRFPCPLCGKMFNQQSNRDRHFTYVHSDLREYECEHCHKLFKNNEDRALHINHVHLRKPWPKRIRNRNTERRRRAEGDKDIVKIPIIGLTTSGLEQDTKVDITIFKQDDDGDTIFKQDDDGDTS